MVTILRCKVVFSQHYAQGNILSRRRGGASACAGYCLYYKERPQQLCSILCAGGMGWRPCPDYHRCIRNRPPPQYMASYAYKGM